MPEQSLTHDHSSTRPQTLGEKLALYKEILVAFFKVGAFTFGGGLAMLPLFEKEVVDNRGWVTREEILDYYALGQSLPGVIAVNSSLFIGYKIAGTPGAVIALIGVMLPSLLIILAIAPIFTEFRHNPYVAKALIGVRAAVAALIFQAALRVGKSSLKDTFAKIAAVIAFLLTFTDINVTWLIIAGGIVGVVVTRYKQQRTATANSANTQKNGGDGQ